MSIISKAEQEAMLKKAGIGSAEKLKSMETSTEEMRDFGGDDLVKNIVANMARHQRHLRERLTLINDSLTKAIPLTRENLYLFCAYSGSGKSTIAANISHPLWKQGKKILVISNEETKEDIFGRIACLEIGADFKDLKNGNMSEEHILSLIPVMRKLAPFIKIYDVTDTRTARLEGVKSILETAKNEDFSCILIDYFQLIKYSEVDNRKEPYAVLSELKDYLGPYAKSSNAPVVLFVQLHSLSKRPSKGTELDNRIKECSFIIEPASVVIEVIPNFEYNTTSFAICKDRFFGRTGKKIVCQFVDGKYMEAFKNKQALVDYESSIKLDKITSDGDELLD